MSAQTPPNGRPPKQLSSRLMTMKFMQRAAASPSSPSSPSTPPSAKRLKTSQHGSPKYPDGPTNPSRTPAFPAGPTDEAGAQVVDDDLRAAMRRAVAEEEGRRQEALARNETASLETRWVLSAEAEADEKEEVRLRVVRWGDEDGDEEDDEAEEAPWRASSGGAGVGRMRFGKWTAREPPQTQKSNGTSDDSGSGSDSDSSREESNQSSATPNRISAGAPMSGDRSNSRPVKGSNSRKRDAHLDQSTAFQSVSSGGSTPAKKKPGMKCFACGKVGHAKADCPSR